MYNAIHSFTWLRVPGEAVCILGIICMQRIHYGASRGFILTASSFSRPTGPGHSRGRCRGGGARVFGKRQAGQPSPTPLRGLDQRPVSRTRRPPLAASPSGMASTAVYSISRYVSPRTPPRCLLSVAVLCSCLLRAADAAAGAANRWSSRVLVLALGLLLLHSARG